MSATISSQLALDLSSAVMHPVCVDTDTRDWKRLGHYAQQRREQLGLTQQEVAARGGPSTATLRIIESGVEGSYRVKTLRQLDVGLGWAPGSSSAVLRGLEPTLAEQVTYARPETVTARAVIPAPSTAAVPTPGEGESAGMAQVDAIRAAMRAELAALREESRQRDEENKAAIAELTDEIRAFREQRGA